MSSGDVKWDRGVANVVFSKLAGNMARILIKSIFMNASKVPPTAHHAKDAHDPGWKWCGSVTIGACAKESAQRRRIAHGACFREFVVKVLVLVNPHKATPGVDIG